MFKGLFLAIVFTAFAIAHTPIQAAPVVPPACASMTFTSTVYATSAATLVNDAGTVLVIGRTTAPNVISVPNAAQSCIVGGTAYDVIQAGAGNDVIVGNGSIGKPDIISGGQGVDTCVGPSLNNCEVVTP